MPAAAGVVESPVGSHSKTASLMKRWRLLKLLDKYPDRSARQLGDMMDGQETASTLQKMLECGEVEVGVDPADRRKTKLWRITQLGRSILKKGAS